MLEYKGRMVFDKCVFCPYTPRKALDRKSFPCHDACVYIFGWNEKDINNEDDDNEDVSVEREGDRWTTIPRKTGKPSHDDDNDVSPRRSSSLIMPVTADVINRIRLIHIENAKRKADGQSQPTDYIDKTSSFFPSNKRNGTRNSKRRKK